jgi:hypothetical protein
MSGMNTIEGPVATDKLQKTSLEDAVRSMEWFRRTRLGSDERVRVEVFILKESEGKPEWVVVQDKVIRNFSDGVVSGENEEREVRWQFFAQQGGKDGHLIVRPKGGDLKMGVEGNVASVGWTSFRTDKTYQARFSIVENQSMNKLRYI